MTSGPPHQTWSAVLAISSSIEIERVSPICDGSTCKRGRWRVSAMVVYLSARLPTSWRAAGGCNGGHRGGSDVLRRHPFCLRWHTSTPTPPVPLEQQHRSSRRSSRRSRSRSRSRSSRMSMSKSSGSGTGSRSNGGGCGGDGDCCHGGGRSNGGQQNVDCHFAAPPSPFSWCINSDGERASAK